jgi:hypothetical protein
MILATTRVRSNLSRWIAVLLFFLLVGKSPLLLAAPPTIYDFRLTQGHAQLPVVTVYADIIGTGEVPAKGLQPTDVKVAVGTSTAQIKRIIPFEDAGEGIGYVLMVDVSKSLSESQFALMKDTIASFVDAMSDADQAALVTFGSDVKVVQEFTPNRSKIKERLAAIGPTDQETAFYNGIDKGIAVARAGGNGVPKRRVVITLSDGVNDLTGGVGKGDIVSRLANDPVPLFLIGFVQGTPTAVEESAIGVMKDFARLSGGRYYDGRGGDWRGIYFAITRAIRSAFLIELDVPNFRSEGSVYELTMTVTAANRAWTEKIQLTIPAGGTIIPPATTSKAGGTSSPETDKSTTTFMEGNQLLYAGFATLVVVAAGSWVWWRRRPVNSKGNPVTESMPNIPSPDQAVILPSVDVPSDPGVLVRLTRIHDGPLPNQFEIEILDRVILGSDPGFSHLVFENDSGISPAHCEILFESGRLYVQDLASSQGTFLNGVELTARQCIEEQDILRLGTAELKISFPS